MDAQSGLACIGFVTAFFAGSLLCVQVFEGARAMARSVRSLRIQSPGAAGPTAASMLLRNGVPLFDSLARYLMRFGCVQRYSVLLRSACRQRGWEATGTALVSMVLAVACTILLVSLLAGIVVFGIVGTLAGLVVVGAAIKQQQDAAQERLRDDVPAVLRSMSACFHSGYTLLQTFQQVADESEGAIAGYFKRAASGLETGKTVNQVLEELRRDADLPELGFVIAALEVQHRTGGSLQHIIDAACDAVNEELSLRRDLRVQTAQSRLSARVVTAMPFVLLAILSLITEDFMAPFFSSAMGVVLFVIALAMQAAGVVLVRRILEVKDE